MNWKGFVLDNMGYFSVYDIPNLIFAILVASALAFACAKFGLRANVTDVKELAVWAGLIALGVGLVKGQLAFAVVLAALLIVVKGPERNGLPRYALLLALVIGLGCGSGAALVTIIASVPVILLLRYAATTN